MKVTYSYTVFARLCSISAVLLLAGSIAAAQPTSTKSSVATGATVATRVVEGTVLQVDGNNLLVRIAGTGEIRHIVAAESQRALINGREVAARDLKVGTKLKATITTNTTSVLDRTTTVGTGKVWYAAGNNVILTLPNGENRQYKVANDYKFTVNGQPATVFELRKGMVVSAEKIVEEPRSVVAVNTVVTGEEPAAAPAPARTETAAAAPAKPAPTPAPAPVAKPAPVAAPAPTPAPTPAPEHAAPATLPKTGSPLPLIGLSGILLTACSLASMRRKNRS